ncbi:MAG: hypothetical protein NVSMB9_33460 [Isosphaeraceae bacterium]
MIDARSLRGVMTGTLLVLTVAGGPARGQTLSQDRGATGTWQAIARLRTTASVLHTTAHPDDEDGGLLTWLSRGRGARVSLLTLNRGEGGDNAVGPELFDALGLIRTEELRLAGRYYGLDHQYFTRVADYGFSKRLDEAMTRWGREDLLRDVVRVIRKDRPLVLISRFQGNAQDGHGQHQAAGLITKEAFEAAGDPDRFPELAEEGILPWRPLKLYQGTGFFGGEDRATVRVDVGAYSPLLGDSFANFARIGYSFHRTQFNGGPRTVNGPLFVNYRRVVEGDSPAREADFFEGIDTTIPGIFKALGRPAPDGVPALLDMVEGEVKAAIAAFRIDDTTACVPALVRGLKATQEASGRCVKLGEIDLAYQLWVKEAQFVTAIHEALGVELSAVAQPASLPEPKGPFAFFTPPPVMGPVVAGQRFEVRVELANRGKVPIRPVYVVLQKGRIDEPWAIEDLAKVPTSELGANQSASGRFAVTVPEGVHDSRAYYRRATIAEDRYNEVDLQWIDRPSADPPLSAVASYRVEGVELVLRSPVRRREANPPYGTELRELDIVPAIAVNIVSPRRAIVPLKDGAKTFPVRVELVNPGEGRRAGTLTLRLPRGWSAEPTSRDFVLDRTGARATFAFDVKTRDLDDRVRRIEAVATVDGKDYREGYEVIRYRDLPIRYLFRRADVLLRGVDVVLPRRLKVGYVMGAGDEIPAALVQLGARVDRLEEPDLAKGDLGQYKTIVTGTRAYAAREDLQVHNDRLLEYVRGGGNLIVLYNTSEFDPGKYAPFPARLPGNAEEVSEEDAAVEILAPDHPAFRKPNTITQADFSGWIEQRGSKFWSTWDERYTPLVGSHDQGQAPQKGGWVTARVGKGHYTYCAYAFHRQLPFGVPGAYRLMANLLSLGETDPPDR